MALNPGVMDSLRKLGLNQYEAKAYHALNSFGEHTAGQLSETAEVPRPRIYDVIERLQSKGFVAIQAGRPVKYRALPIAEAVKTLKRQKQDGLVNELDQIEKLGKELSGRLTPGEGTASSEESVWTLKGRDAIYSKLGTMLAGAKNHIVLNSSQEGLLQKLKANEAVLLKAKKRGAKIHFVSPEALTGEESKLAHACFGRSVPTRMAIADDQALLFLTEAKTNPEDEVGLWIKSPHIAETLKKIVGG